jgi:hypothetical protein
VRILGVVFVGTATEHRAEMTAFARDVLQLDPTRIGGVDADLFALANDTLFAVASPGEMGETRRSVGFLVDDVIDAAAELEAAGYETGELARNERHRYVHFRAPDGCLYELIDERGGGSG